MAETRLLKGPSDEQALYWKPTPTPARARWEGCLGSMDALATGCDPTSSKRPGGFDDAAVFLLSPDLHSAT